MNNIIVNILVIGFHHKRGCEIEFVYPHIESDMSSNVSEIWKNLCSVALPDGVHKLNTDTFQFILPGNDKNKHKILFGISCFKQISSDNIKNKSEEITRNTIQKSVVVLSSQPFFNAIGSLLQGITENYFEIGDFNERDILVESYHQLNEHFRLVLEDRSIKNNNDLSNLINQGFSLSDLILRYEHDIFTLIKLIMLRRKIMFFMEPISKLTSTILCLISLFTSEFTGSKFQEIMKYVDELSNENDLVEIVSNEDIEDVHLSEDDVNLNSNDSDKSSNNESKLSTGTSLFQNIKSGGGQAIKVLSSFSVSGLMRSPESDNTKPSQIDDLSAPLPPFIDKVGYVRDNDKLDFNNLRDSWGFPLGIFDERNILLPYASLGYLNMLDSNKIHSFLIGTSNHLWRTKFSKIDVIINEDNKNGGIEYCNKEPNINRKSDDGLIKLTQLTVLDRRLADYLLRVVKAHNSPSIKKSNSTSSLSQVSYSKHDDSYSDLSNIEIGEDILVMKQSFVEPDHTFTDQKSLEEWLRQVLLDYMRSLLLSAASWGNRQSFTDFGWDFMLAIQQQNYFKEWFYSVDKEKVIQESKSSFSSIRNPESILSLNQSGSLSKDNLEMEYNRKNNIIMTYDHPGRFVPGKFGDNIPGYYQIKEYAGQSRAIVNRGVTEIKRIGTETSSQLKSSVSAGFSKLSGMAKVHSTKWWQSDPKISNKISDVNDKPNV